MRSRTGALSAIEPKPLKSVLDHGDDSGGSQKVKISTMGRQDPIHRFPANEEVSLRDERENA
jgi:hypothetical protein